MQVIPDTLAYWIGGQGEKQQARFIQLSEVRLVAHRTTD